MNRVFFIIINYYNGTTLGRPTKKKKLKKRFTINFFGTQI